MNTGNGVLGQTTIRDAAGVCGLHQGNGFGVAGFADAGDGVIGTGNRGVVGVSGVGHGVLGLSGNGHAVHAVSREGTGVHGQSELIGPGVVGHVQIPAENSEAALNKYRQNYYDQFVNEEGRVSVHLGPLDDLDGIFRDAPDSIEVEGPVGVIGRGPIGVKGIGNPGVVGIDKEGDRERTAAGVRGDDARMLRERGRRAGVYARGNPAIYAETRGDNLIVGDVLVPDTSSAAEIPTTVFSVSRDGRGRFEGGLYAAGNSALRLLLRNVRPGRSNNLIFGEVFDEIDQRNHTIFYVDATGRGHFRGGYEAGGFDLAETFTSREAIEAGSVVEIDPHNEGEFRLCGTPASTSVAGVVSTDPGVSLGAWQESSLLPKLALAGRVPVKVSAENGTIRPGDLLVSSSTPGHAMRAPETPEAGTVIGKALGRLEDGIGEIELLIMLR